MKRILIFLFLIPTCLAVTPSINSFNGGQLMPEMESRWDFGATAGTFHSKYSSSCRTLENFFPLSQGPATRRPGTKYIATVKSGSPILLPFDSSVLDTYVIEAGNLYARFYRNGGQIQSGGNPFEIVTPFLQADLLNIQISQVSDTMYMVDGTNPPQKLVRADHDDWTIIDAPITTGPFQTQNETATTIDPTGYSLAADAGAETFTITGSGDLSSIFTDSKNFLVAGSTANDGTWTVSSTNAADPFIITVTGDITDGTNDGTIMVKGGIVTLTASADVFNTGHAGNGSLWEINQDRGTSVLSESLTTGTLTSSSTASFTGGYSFTTSGTWVATVALQRSTDDGVTWDNALSPLSDINFDNPAESEGTNVLHRVLMSNWTSGTVTFTHTITDSFNRGIAQIDTFTTARLVSGTIIQNMASGTPTTRWREGYWSDFRGWPKTVQIHHQRLIFGGSDSFPQTVWFGKADADDYENFSEGTLDTSSFTVALEGQNPITWLLGEDYLFMGTSGSVGRYGINGEAHTPTSPDYREQSRNGAKNIQAQLAGNAILYIERAGRRVREFGFSLSADKYQSTDMTQISADITKGGIIDVAFQSRPDPVLWCVLDGDIATLTYLREQNVIAWSLQNTDGDFESVAIIPSSDEDEVWVVVNRDAGRFIEQFQPRDWGSDDDDAWYVDAGISYSGVATTSFTGATHLANEVVSVYADGIIQPDVTVDGAGAFTLGLAAENVIVGLPYTSKLETMPLITSQEDSFFDKKIKFINMDLLESKTMSYSNRPGINLTKVNFFDTAGFTAVQPLYTSTRSPKHLPWIYGGTKKQTVYIETSEPAPLTIRAIGIEYKLGR